MKIDLEAINSSLAVELNKVILKKITSDPTIDIQEFLEEINPTTVTKLPNELSKNDIKEFLQSLHTIQWGNWIITSQDGLEDAASWLQDVISRINSYLAIRNNGNG